MISCESVSTTSDALSSSTTFVTLYTRNDRGLFSGLNGTDVNDWLNFYKRISTNYSYPTTMLSDAIFYLGGTSGVRFETQEHELTSWENFKPKTPTYLGTP